jgi:hypothetical protein
MPLLEPPPPPVATTWMLVTPPGTLKVCSAPVKRKVCVVARAGAAPKSSAHSPANTANQPRWLRRKLEISLA